MAIRKRKTRMYEPWGFIDENHYESSEAIIENDLNSFFSGAQYKKDDNKIHFTNKDGEEVASIDVSEFPGGGSGGDKEFKDGLIDENNVVKVKIDDASEGWLSVSEDGVKISGIQDEIDRLDGRINDEIDRATGEEERIEGKLDTEVQERKNDVASLNESISQEEARAISAETELSNRIESIESGSTEKLNELIEKLGYTDNETLQRNNEHEVAFGQYNISNTGTEPSGRTAFSIGVGTSDADRKNALEVREDGDVYLWIEGEYMNINKLLGQIAHEIY